MASTLNHKMANKSKIADKEVIRKRSINDSSASDSIEKRPRTHRTDTTLLDLNDHCLLTIFENLNEIDICHVQNVCRRFVPLATSAFTTIRRRSPEKMISKLRYSNSELRRMIYKFGELFDWTSLTAIESILVLRSSLVRMHETLEGLKVWKRMHLRTFHPRT